MPQQTVTHAPDLPTVLAGAAPSAAVFDAAASPEEELERQLRALVELGLPALLGTEEAGLRALVEPLRDLLPAAGAPTDVPREDHVPFVLVLALGRPNDAVPAMRLGRRSGVSVIDDAELATFRPVVPVPPGRAYLLRDVDTGSRYLSVTPEDARRDIQQQGRRPLTVAEGLALVALRPDMLRPGRCFSLAGSRTGTNQRVPAIWISERRPKLGWCWDRNPHTWLGTASAGDAVA